MRGAFGTSRAAAEKMSCPAALAAVSSPMADAAPLGEPAVASAAPYHRAGARADADHPPPGRGQMPGAVIKFDSPVPAIGIGRQASIVRFRPMTSMSP